MSRLDTRPDWTETERSEMFTDVIVAVDAARAEAIEMGDEHFVRHVEERLFPFLEAEKEVAKKRESMRAGN
jgi:hypothetical protein